MGFKAGLSGFVVRGYKYISLAAKIQQSENLGHRGGF